LVCDHFPLHVVASLLVEPTHPVELSGLLVGQRAGWLAGLDYVGPSFLLPFFPPHLNSLECILLFSIFNNVRQALARPLVVAVRFLL
jgi:hypothetical protein